MTKMNRQPYIPTKPALMPYCNRFREFCDGADSPQAFLERCLEKIDHLNKDIKAFAALNIAGPPMLRPAVIKRVSPGLS
jgi:hypothetical protein